MSKITTNWYIVTGAPCSGKTKIIERLAFLGYKTYPEISRILFDNLKSKNIKINSFFRNQEQLEYEIAYLKEKLERRTNINDICFFDRSLIDSYAFMNFHSVNHSKLDNLINYKYKKIFFLERLPYIKDSSRIHTENECFLIESLLKAAYKDKNYMIVDIPKDSIEDRTKIILDNIY